VLRSRTDLQGDRNVELFIQACIEEQRRQDELRPAERHEAPIDFLQV
jgi:hypothetical protein